MTQEEVCVITNHISNDTHDHITRDELVEAIKFLKSESGLLRDHIQNLNQSYTIRHTGQEARMAYFDATGDEVATRNIFAGI